MVRATKNPYKYRQSCDQVIGGSRTVKVYEDERGNKKQEVFNNDKFMGNTDNLTAKTSCFCNPLYDCLYLLMFSLGRGNEQAKFEKA